MSDIIVEAKLSTGKILWESLSFTSKPDHETKEKITKEIKQRIMKDYKDSFERFI